MSHFAEKMASYMGRKGVQVLICLPSTKWQNFTLVQIESICRRQNKCKPKIETGYGMAIENIVGKVENAGYQHFLLFPQCFK